MNGSAAGESQRLIGLLQNAQRNRLSRGSANNASCRSADGFVITPTSVAIDAMDPTDLVSVDTDGIPTGSNRPGHSWVYHSRIYQHRPEVQAIVNLQSPCATALSTLHSSIPPFHYMVGVAGGHDIRCSTYAAPGSEELADAVILAISDRTACLVANHGLVACGESVQAAFNMADEIEALAEHYVLAKSIGTPVLLTPNQ